MAILFTPLEPVPVKTPLECCSMATQTIDKNNKTRILNHTCRYLSPWTPQQLYLLQRVNSISKTTSCDAHKPSTRKIREGLSMNVLSGKTFASSDVRPYLHASTTSIICKVSRVKIILRVPQGRENLQICLHVFDNVDIALLQAKSARRGRNDTKKT